MTNTQQEIAIEWMILISIAALFGLAIGAIVLLQIPNGFF
jgi:hypothetical protein